jgi:hypothetical protein
MIYMYERIKYRGENLDDQESKSDLTIHVADPTADGPRPKEASCQRPFWSAKSAKKVCIVTVTSNLWIHTSLNVDKKITNYIIYL